MFILKEENKMKSKRIISLGIVLALAHITRLATKSKLLLGGEIVFTILYQQG